MIRSIVVENGFSPNSVQPLEPKILLPDCIVAEGQKIEEKLRCLKFNLTFDDDGTVREEDFMKKGSDAKRLC